MRALFALTTSAVDRLWEVGRDLIVIVVPAIGGAVLAWLRSRRRRLAAEAAARAHDREILYALADVLQILLERQIWQDWLTSTNRLHPLAEGDMREQRGAYRQREHEAADRLRELLGNDRRSGARTTRPVVEPERPQDMFAAGDDTP